VVDQYLIFNYGFISPREGKTLTEALWSELQKQKEGVQ
jgi:hypothetical protein